MFVDILTQIQASIMVSPPHHSYAPSCDLGVVETIGGIKTYIATPSGEYAKDKALIFISDVFGLKLNNNLVRVLSLAPRFVTRLLIRSLSMSTIPGRAAVGGCVCQERIQGVLPRPFRRGRRSC